MLKKSQNYEENPRPIWEILFPYIGTLVALLGVVFILLSALFGAHSPLLASVLRDIGLAMLPIGIISLLFEWLLRKHYAITLKSTVRDELRDGIGSVTESIVESIVDQVIRKKQTIDVEALKAIDKMKILGLDRLLTRAELEVSDISFKNVVELLKEEQEDKEFFIFGKTLEFISRQRHILSEGLKQGIHFRFSLIDPNIDSWDTEYIKSCKEKSQNSIDKFRHLLNNPDSRWTGTLELRKTKKLVENSFSSFVYNGKRINVLDFDLGEDQSLQCSQVYVHNVNVKNFAAYLYLLNRDNYMKAQFVLSYPLRYMYVYVYGIKDGKIVLVRKKGKDTWELPGGKIETGEIVEETAKREFLEETNYDINILHSIETMEEEKLAFIGKIGNKVGNHEEKEIKEIHFFSLEQFPEKENLSFPHTNYKKIISEIERYVY
jgi:8-oxo-dGTP diphosphatase